MHAHLFVKVPRPKDSKGTFSVFESSCHLPLIGRGSSIKCLAKDTTSELAGLSSVLSVKQDSCEYQL